MNRYILVAIAIGSASQALGQASLTDICQSIAQSGLTDRYSRATILQTAEDEFDLFCLETSRQEQRLRSSNSGFRASFEDAAQSIGIGGRGENNRSLQSEEITQMCEVGKSVFASFYSDTESVEISSIAATRAVECVALVADSDTIFGYTEAASHDPTLFHARFFRNARLDGDVWEFQGLTQGNVECLSFAGGQTPVGEKLYREFAVTCPRSGVSQSAAMTGDFRFTKGDASRNVSFSVSGVVVDRAEELQSQVDSISSRLAEVEARLMIAEQALQAVTTRAQNNAEAISSLVVVKSGPTTNRVDKCLRSGPGNNRPITTDVLRECYFIAQEICGEGFKGGFISGGMSTRNNTARVVCIR